MSFFPLNYVNGRGVVAIMSPKSLALCRCLADPHKVCAVRTPRSPSARQLFPFFRSIPRPTRFLQFPKHRLHVRDWDAPIASAWSFDRGQMSFAAFDSYDLRVHFEHSREVLHCVISKHYSTACNLLGRSSKSRLWMRAFSSSTRSIVL